jgi:hypothetical protein
MTREHDLREHLRTVEAQIADARRDGHKSLLRNLQRERRAILDALTAYDKAM